MSLSAERRGEFEFCASLDCGVYPRPLGEGRVRECNLVRSHDSAAASLDQLVRPREHLPRNRYADFLRLLEIDHQLKLRRLLDGKIGSLGSLEDSVHEICDAPV